MFKAISKLGLGEILILFCILAKTTFANDESSTSPGVLYYGFFFNVTTAQSMKNISDTYFNITLSSLPEFSSFIQSVSSAANVTDPYQFYAKPLDPNSGKFDPLYHTTAKYCGQDQVACAEYEKKHSKAIDSQFEMHLVGYVLTSRTFGIRVDLTNEQRELFDEETRKSSKLLPTATTKLLHSSSLPGDIRWEQQQPFPPPVPVTNTRAHVTLGCAPGVSAVVTGPDALLAIDYEIWNNSAGWVTESWDNITDPIDENKMKVTLFKPAANSTPSDYLFVIYPHVKLFANATLARYYHKSTESAASKVTFGDNTFNLLFFILLTAGTWIFGRMQNGY